MRAPGTGAVFPQDHGGNLREVRERYGLEQIVDFSASINPLGHPEGLWEHLGTVWDEVLHYPDRDCEALCRAVAARFGVPRETVVAGNGSAELIDLLLRRLRPRRLVVCPPDFGLYDALAPAGTPVVGVPRIESEGFALDLEGLAHGIAPGDAVILSNPGNPSGCAAAPEGLVALGRRASEVGATLILDEAFADFCPEYSVLPRGAGAPGLVVLRSMTKFYGIPGLRLGFLVAHPAVARAVAELQVPWSVNALAQAAGAYCLETADWEERTLEYVGRQRARLAAALERLPGLRPLPSRANYLLVEVAPPAPPASEIYDGAVRRGVLVRHCGSFGLGERYLRVAVRTADENARLVEALAGALGVDEAAPALGPPARGEPPEAHPQGS